jgi:hemoglobin-like flavoprotein
VCTHAVRPCAHGFSGTKSANSPGNGGGTRRAEDALMPLDPILLRESFDLVVERSPNVTSRFYEIFFERYPEAGALFGTGPVDVARHGRILTSALVAVLAHLEDGPWLEKSLVKLGAAHVRYGVRDEMYAWVGECLLAALAEGAGDAWTDEMQVQWTGAFGVIQTTMLMGAVAEREINASKPSSQPFSGWPTQRVPAPVV